MPGRPTHHNSVHLEASDGDFPPIKLKSGTLLPTAEQGSFEYIPGHLYFTDVDRHAFVFSEPPKATTTTVTNTAIETAFYTYSFDPNVLHADQKIVYEATGAYSNASGADDFTIRFKINGVTRATVSRASGNVTDNGFETKFEATIRTNGATGTYVFLSRYNDGNTEVLNADITEHTIDTTAAALFEVTIQWDNAKVGNTFSCTQACILFIH